MAESPFKFCSNCGGNDWIARSVREFQCGPCGHRHFITSIPAAVALVLDAEDRLLVIRRGHEPGLGRLGLPGGVIEPEETAEMAAARETQEEVGIDLPASAFTYLASLNNRYLFQGYEWPTIDLCYVARVPDFSRVVIQPSEVMETLVCALEDVPLEEFAFKSNAEAIRRLRARQTSVRAL
ncbi:NUDIX domain-containing protein [Prosthecobacter sp.]|uniref:NUDIX domain-containing protein n=1 Tax=Prosthecobacter sp. TaxID=1965333 RepID=UPI001D468624|nr:NUDIX domain-containing protein [Prosthecobacter sp.]MCB1277567.1 NUDIX domain-containing protein [Prosthecobacter sp.]